MAIPQSPNSKAATISSPTKKKRKNTVSNTVDVDEIKTEMTSDSQPQKRNKNPGVRVIRGRIYDSVNGTTCHQVCIVIILYIYNYVSFMLLSMILGEVRSKTLIYLAHASVYIFRLFVNDVRDF